MPNSDKADAEKGCHDEGLTRCKGRVKSVAGWKAGGGKGSGGMKEVVVVEVDQEENYLSKG